MLRPILFLLLLLTCSAHAQEIESSCTMYSTGRTLAVDLASCGDREATGVKWNIDGAGFGDFQSRPLTYRNAHIAEGTYRVVARIYFDDSSDYDDVSTMWEV